ncbi:putative aldouronate transport system substrate-binding protein [Paenibacillus sp. 1_12]|uniref:extracellular solute-binding protein n=1 Tax=Paenibacillus sp. 1_12 TaxID=1566278 RepID=UPI0008F41262|nr:extracellular solute-binding protein [Paenibacillus sp. 1_12]SFK79171.1 putative aldouronate transport system substrate-binding protein [Paenibacillus sp. 1_12]
MKSKRCGAISALCVMSLVTAACSSGGSSSSAPASGKAENGPPTEISIITEFHTPEPPGPDNPVLKEIEKRTNTKINMIWVSPNNWDEKQSVTLASGDIPDLMKISDITNPLMQQMVNQGAFWDLTPYIQNYPHLMEYPKSVWESTRINDKNFAIHSVRPIEGGGFPAVRKDWLDKLHLQVPTTTDEMYKVWQAFTDSDPDGNGKKDTFGYNMRDWSPMMDNIFNKSNGKWKLKDGKLVDVASEPGTREMLVYLNKAYKDELIPRDFSVMKTSQAEELATSSKSGFTSDTILGLWRQIDIPMKTNPSADFLALTTLNGVALQSPGFLGVYLIPKKVPEAKVKKILALMDFGASEEGASLAINGIKDVHYKEVDGFKVAMKQADVDSISVSSFGKVFERFDKYLWAYAPGMPKEIFERNKKIVDERSKVSIADPSIGLISQTGIQVGGEYNKKISDMKIKVIMGKETIEAWDSFVSKLKEDAQYQKIVMEMNKAYQEKKK